MYGYIYMHTYIYIYICICMYMRVGGWVCLSWMCWVEGALQLTINRYG